MREIKYRAYTKEYGVKPVRELMWNRDRSIAAVSLSNGITVLTNRRVGKGIVVEQYTGINDKNGNEIYEGDIVEVVSQYWGQLGNRYEVKFESGSFTVKYGSLAEIRPSVLVIGNIHEDKELLGERE